MSAPARQPSATTPAARGSRRVSSASAFSLVELLVVTAILVVLAGVLANLFSSTEASVRRSTDHSQADADARAVFATLTRDLSQAVADEFLGMRIGDGSGCYSFSNTVLSFVSLQETRQDGRRDACLISYVVGDDVRPWGTRYVLTRGVSELPSSTTTGSTDNAYWSDAWLASPTNMARQAVLAENVAAFRIGVPDDGDMVRTYDAHGIGDDRPPPYVDVYLELLDDSDARRAADMIQRGLDVDDTIDARVRRYATRIAIPHRTGYSKR